jgi:hypothetical protein
MVLVLLLLWVRLVLHLLLLQLPFGPLRWRRRVQHSRLCGGLLQMALL